VLAGAGTRAAEADPDLADAEKTLQEQKVAADGPSLLAFFRARTLSAADRARLADTVRRLGDESFAVREQASRALERAGRAALPFLRPARKDPDLEVARRAAECLRSIEGGSEAALAAAAARVLAARRPAGAAAVLLAYLPAAEDENLEEAILDALAVVGVAGGRADPALAAALADKEPARRAAAAHVLGRAVTGQRAAVRRLLADPDSKVRFRAAAALVRAEDKAAVPALIALLAEGPADLAWPAEDLLCRLVGEQSPPATLGDGNEAERRRCRAAWAAWWKANAARADLAALGREEAALGLYVLSEHNESGKGMGRVWACGRDGKQRWEIDSVTHPVDARLLPGGRVLVAEHQGKRVTERDRQGKVLWQHPVTNHAVSCQRLPNGNTFIATYTEVLEVTRAGKTVFSYRTRRSNVYGAHKLRTGHILYTDDRGIVELDAGGTEVRHLDVPGTAGWGRAEPLPNGHFLVAQYTSNQVVEVDPGGKVVWRCAVTTPSSATRLRNGNVLVTSSEGHKLVEIDRGGKEVWAQAAKGRPFSARRY
jgi:HEAT repeat protein